jgi:hypothetical protein
MFHPGARGRPNSRMHPTRDTRAFKFLLRCGRAGDAGVRSPERAGLRTQEFHPGALERPNIGMHATRDTTALIRRYLAGGRVMPALDASFNLGEIYDPKEF